MTISNEKREFKKRDAVKDMTSSTLSLHIDAFEKSIESKTDSSCESSIKNSITPLTSAIFEFPRQQNADARAPEVSSFRSSQRLLNPNAESFAEFSDRRISVAKRLRLVSLLNNGESLSSAARILGISITGARYARDRILQTGSVGNRKAASRVSQEYETNRFIEEQLRKHPRIKTKELRLKMADNGVEMSVRQLRFRISSLGYRWRKMKKVQVISKENQQKRLLARAFWEAEGYPFDRYLFVDECTVVLGRRQQFCWVKRGHRVPCQGRVSHGDGFHIYGGISWFGASQLLIWRSKSRMNSAFYCKHNIKDIVVPSQSLFPGGKFELAQDNHRAHISIDTHECLQKLGIRTYDWPPQSPEFNPIEYLWRDMKQFIAEHSPSSLEELKKLIEQFWYTKVTPEYCRTLIRQVIKNIKKSHDGLNHEKDTATEALYQK
uniref:Tc1-like transposase DDE domain-containing protein n=1 Tax=Panagrolaimus davidi TaxID=227884 RepID=A0A914PZ68_9BILA